MLVETLQLLKNIRIKGYKGSLSEYKENRGYKAWEYCIKTNDPQKIVEVIKESELRGRGGAGFPTGLKWSFMSKNSKKPSYLICNADEGEPGTFKDRELMLKDPHLFLEGMIIGCFAVGCKIGYIYVRGEYYEAIDRLRYEILELNKAGILGENIFDSTYSLKLIVHPGAGAYICGEETALLDSLEGKRGLPRVKPPFPAVSGFDKSPTSVNNVETLANLPYIINNGSDAYKEYGLKGNYGTRIVSLSGMINNPGAYEVEMGDNLLSIINDLGGGVIKGSKIKAVIPGGSSSPILKANEIDIKYDFDTLQKVGSMSGSGAIVVLDQSVDIVKLLYRLIEFYCYESCGQCTPCREGMNWLRILLRDLISRKLDSLMIDQIYRIANNIAGNTLCPLGDAGALPVISYIEKFRDEFEKYTIKANKT